MSRTDKDMPDWVTAEWWEIRHFRCQHTLWHRRPCDLPPAPRRQNPGRSRRACHWIPVTDRCRWWCNAPRR